MKKVKVYLSVIASLLVCWFIFNAYVYKTKDRELKKPELLDKLPAGFDSAYVSELQSLGMNAFSEAKILTYTTNRQFYKSKFGLNFIGDDELKIFLEDNNFIIGGVDRYKYMIPPSAGKLMLSNIYKIQAARKECYLLILPHNNITYKLSAEDLVEAPNDGDAFTWHKGLWDNKGIKYYVKPDVIKKNNIIISDFWEIKKEVLPKDVIQIIGSSKYFNTEGMVIEEHILKQPAPKDPIAVMKVKDGYVELSNWE